MNDVAGRNPHCGFAQGSGEEVAFANDYDALLVIQLARFLVRPSHPFLQKDGWHEHGYHLFSSPEWNRLDNGRRWNSAAILVRHFVCKRHHEVHDLFASEKDLHPSHEVDACKSILNQPHRRFVGLRSQDVMMHRHDLLEFCRSLHRLDLYTKQSTHEF